MADLLDIMANIAQTQFNLGLIGYPLGHSLSPLIQNAALAAKGLAGEYRLYPVPQLPQGIPALRDLLEHMRNGQIHGLNVTIPHKQSVLKYLDDLTPPARAIGAVNTIFTAEEQLIGDNTDAAGFREDLYSQFTGVRNFQSALVLGAGGSARAVVYTLLREGWKVAVASRRIAQAESLVESIERSIASIFPSDGLQQSSADRWQAIELNSTGLSDYLERLSNQNHPGLLIVNTTPVGMAPAPDASPWPENIPLPQHSLVYDLVYNPPETALVLEARVRGIPASNGLGMLILQAALAFERWTGYPASKEVMYTAVSEWMHISTQAG